MTRVMLILLRDLSDCTVLLSQWVTGWRFLSFLCNLICCILLFYYVCILVFPLLRNLLYHSNIFYLFVTCWIQQVWRQHVRHVPVCWVASCALYCNARLDDKLNLSPCLRVLFYQLYSYVTHSLYLSSMWLWAVCIIVEAYLIKWILSLYLRFTFVSEWLSLQWDSEKSLQRAAPCLR